MPTTSALPRASGDPGVFRLNRSAGLWLAGAVILAPGLALADPADTTGQATPTPVTDQAASNVTGLVVTATKVPTEKLRVANSVTVITAQDIALKQQQTLPDVLADAPGLNVVQQGGPGGLTSVFMRGTNSDHVKVLVDGIDVGDPSSQNDTFDFGQFPTADIARVEILRGPQSGLYGSDAIGGVIDITTQAGEGPPHVTLDVNGGSFDTANESGGVSGSTGPFHYAATVAHIDVGATPVTPLDALAAGEARNDDSYENFTASTKLGYDVTGNFDLGLVARYTSSHLFETGDDDFAFGFPDPVQSQSDDRQYYLRGTGHLSLAGGRLDQTLGVAYSNLQSTDITPNFGVSLFYGSRWKVDWQGDVKLSDTETLVLGAEHQRDAISQPTTAGISIDSGYAELQSNLFKDFNDTISVRYDENSNFGSAFTYRIAPTYFVEATDTKLEASVGTGFKAPSLSDLFESFPAFGFFADPNLRPEKSLGYDAGFEQYLWERRVQFGATWYYNHITDLITDNAAFTTDINVGKAHTDGVESFVLVQPLSTLSFRLDYTYTVAQDDILHQELIRRPRNKWNFDARWQATPKLSLDASLLSVSNWVDGNRDFSIPRLTAPGYTTVNVAANYALTHQLTLYGRVNNLFNEHYEDPFGFLRPSLGVFGGVKASF
jgi:vitamin B12 transporter